MRKNILVFILAILILMSMTTAISIGKESLSKDRKTDVKVTEKQDLSEESKEGKEELKESKNEKSEGEAEEEGEAEKPAWKFTGWQAVFALIAVGYYILVLKFLPFIVEKKNSGGHH